MFDIEKVEPDVCHLISGGIRRYARFQGYRASHQQLRGALKLGMYMMFGTEEQGELHFVEGRS